MLGVVLYGGPVYTVRQKSRVVLDPGDRGPGLSRLLPFRPTDGMYHVRAVSGLGSAFRFPLRTPGPRWDGSAVGGCLSCPSQVRSNMDGASLQGQKVPDRVPNTVASWTQ